MAGLLNETYDPTGPYGDYLGAGGPRGPVAKTPNTFGDVGSRLGNEALAAGLAYLSPGGATTASALYDDPSMVARLGMYPVDVLLGGLLAAQGGLEKLVGYGAELAPGGTASERRLARDILGMGEALAGSPMGALGRTSGLLDDDIGTAARSAAETLAYRMNQPSANPRTTLYSGLPGIGDNGGPYLESTRSVPTRYRTLDAARGLKQSAGTPQQMLAAMRKAGASETEIEWSGVVDWMGAQTKVSKDDLVRYLEDSIPDVDVEVKSASGLLGGAEAEDLDTLIERYVELNFEHEADYYRTSYLPEYLEQDGWRPVSSMDDVELLDLAENAGEDVDADDFDLAAFRSRVGSDSIANPDEGEWAGSFDELIDDRYDPEEMARESLYENARYGLSEGELRDEVGASSDEVFEAGDTEYSEYFLPGVTDYNENLYTLDLPEGVNSPVGRDHWATGGGDEPPLLMHTRTGTLPDNTLFVGEIQSDWAQALHKSPDTPANYSQMQDMYRADEIETDLASARAAARRYIEAGGGFPDRVVGHGPLVTPTLSANYLASMRPLDAAENPLGLPVPDDPMTRQAALFEADTGYGGLLAEDAAIQQRLRPGASYAAPSDDYVDIVPRQGELFEPGTNYGAPLAEAAATSQRIVPSGPMMGSTNQWVDFALRRSLQDAVNQGRDYIAFPSGDAARTWTYGKEEGQRAFYDRIVRQRMDKLLRSFDKRGAPAAEAYRHTDPQGTDRLLYRYRLTPEFRDAIRNKGMPYLSIGTGGLLGAGVYGQQEEGY